MENEILALKKANKANRVLLIILLILVFLMFAMLVAVGVAGYMGYQAIIPYIDELKTFDVASFNKVCDDLSKVDLPELAKTLTELEKEVSQAADSLASLEETVNGIKTAFAALLGF